MDGRRLRRQRRHSQTYDEERFRVMLDVKGDMALLPENLESRLA